MEWRTRFSRKRHPTDELIEEQPLAKRFSLLHLNNSKSLLNGHQNGYTKQKELQPYQRQPPPIQEERMEVDGVVYIDSLDSDSEIDELDSKVVFLPDVDRQLTKIPYNLCTHPSKNTVSTSTEVVLYTVPTSLTVPERNDSVRRAIIETRARMRQKQAEEVQAQAASTATALSAPKIPQFVDPAAMEQIDAEDGVDAMDIE